MTGGIPSVFSIPVGVPFLPRLADAVLGGELVNGSRFDGDPLALADVTIYLPTRRATRELRSIFVDRLGGISAILPEIKPLGDIDDDGLLFDGNETLLELRPPIEPLERLLQLAPLVRAWKSRLPSHVAAMFEEPMVVPVTTADAIWLSRDVAALMDEVELEGADWAALPGLVERDLAAWWQITLDFLNIVTEFWPQHLAECQRMNPAEHRNKRIAAEAARLANRHSTGPVIAAGSTGSIPATAGLLSVIARLPQGAVVLPGLDRHLDEVSWQLLSEASDEPSLFGHPQFGLRKLLQRIGTTRETVTDLKALKPDPLTRQIAARVHLVSEAMRPAQTTDQWIGSQDAVAQTLQEGALERTALVEAASERDEALAIAIALRRALHFGDTHTALVTSDRALARRVSAELERYGIIADDSAGKPLSASPPATLMIQIVACVFSPGDPLLLLSLLKHPLLRFGMSEDEATLAASTLELVVLRTGAGRPDIAVIDHLLEDGLQRLDNDRHQPMWFARLDEKRIETARELAKRLKRAITGLAVTRMHTRTSISELARLSVEAFEAAGGGTDGSVSTLYDGEEGEAMASFLRDLLAVEEGPDLEPLEWPDVLGALIAGRIVKPQAGADTRVSIWGALEARLQNVDTIVLGGLNEGNWPAKTDADRFMSRFMKTGLGLEPPERRVGLAAHDFVMALGAPNVVLTRSLRTGETPAVASRWLQRLLTVIGSGETEKLKARGRELLTLKDALDAAPDVRFAARPVPAPPLNMRPQRFSVTEVETLRRDPYAIHAKRILRLEPLERPVTDPGAFDRGSIFHEILHHLAGSGIDLSARDAEERLDKIARGVFDAANLPDDVIAIWWPRYRSTAAGMLRFEAELQENRRLQLSEVASTREPIGETGAVLSGRADRIVLRDPDRAEILDFKTGSNPSVKQARTLLAPQLALEGALLTRGAFEKAGRRNIDDLVFVRLRPNGEVKAESILKDGKQQVDAGELCETAWRRLIELMEYYQVENQGYLSRALPFKEGDTDGDYDHLARVLEWSAGAADSEDDA